MKIIANLKNSILILVFFAFSLITFFSILNHAPWRDEAQSWLIVRDLSFQEVISQMPYEGTPPLWHMMVKPLVELNLPYSFQNYLHYLISLTAIFILLFLINLPKIIKILLAFNYYFLFEYTVIARNYSISILLLFLILSIYKQRFQRPLLYSFFILLLFLSNIHSFIPALMLAIYFSFEIWQKNKLSWKNNLAILISFIGTFLTILVLLPSSNQSSGLNFQGWHYLIISSSAALLPAVNFNNYNYFWPLTFVWPILISYLLFSKKAQTFFLTSLAWLFFIFLYKHSGDLRHYGLILIFFVFSLGLDLIERKDAPQESLSYYRAGLFLLTIILAFNIIFSAVFLYKHSKENFSGSKEMAQYLKDNNLLSEEIASYPSYIGTALLPYLPNKKMYQPEIQDRGTFITWSNDYFQGLYSPFPVLEEKMKNYYLQNTPPVESILFLTSDFVESEDWELLHQNTRPSLKKDEFFYLYRLNLVK